jgi:hypothetical protein
MSIVYSRIVFLRISTEIVYCTGWASPESVHPSRSSISVGRAPLPFTFYAIAPLGFQKNRRKRSADEKSSIRNFVYR